MINNNNNNNNNSTNNNDNNNNNNNNVVSNENIEILIAVCYQSLGQFKNAVNYYSKVLINDQLSCSWYQREIALHLWSKLDKNCNSFCIDNEIDPRLKDGWCKRASWRHILPSAESSSSTTSRYVPMSQPKLVPDFDSSTTCNETIDAGSEVRYDIDETDTRNQDKGKNEEAKNEKENSQGSESAIAHLVRITAPYGNWMQMRCIGFLPNQRQVNTYSSVH